LTVPDGPVFRVHSVGSQVLAERGVLTADDIPAVAIYARCLDEGQTSLNSIEAKLLWDFSLRVIRGGLADEDSFLAFEALLENGEIAFDEVLAIVSQMRDVILSTQAVD
jgi:hypothetical protein